MKRERRFWMSPGARLGFAGVIAIIVLVFAGLYFPQHATQVRQDRAEQVRLLGIRQGAALLHRFDCTYGTSIRATLLSAERSARTSAQLALANRRRAIQRGDRKAANISLQSRRNSQRAAASYHRQRMALVPLGRSYQGIPVPPC